jgi:hypothetical protein
MLRICWESWQSCLGLSHILNLGRDMKDIIVYDESISRFKTNSWVEHIFWRDPEGLADLDSVIARMVTNSEECSHIMSKSVNMCKDV